MHGVFSSIRVFVALPDGSGIAGMRCALCSDGLTRKNGTEPQSDWEMHRKSREKIPGRIRWTGVEDWEKFLFFQNGPQSIDLPQSRPYFVATMIGYRDDG
jgi:hypothetical protein